MARGGMAGFSLTGSKEETSTIGSVNKIEVSATNKLHDNRPHVTGKVGNTEIQWLVDTGASISLIDYNLIREEIPN